MTTLAIMLALFHVAAVFTSVLAVIAESVQLAIIALIGSVIAMIGSIVTPIIMYLLKERSDAKARETMKEEARAARKVINDKLDANTNKLDENTAITAEVKQDAITAYKEANNLNLKMESLGIQTKPKTLEVTVINDREHPVPTRHS